MSSVKLCALIALLSLGTLANGRVLLQDVHSAVQNAGPADGIRMGASRNGTMVPLKNGYWHFEYELGLLQRGDIQVYAGETSIDMQYGCGAGAWLKTNREFCDGWSWAALLLNHFPSVL